ncbi:HAMP domain-containing sensor histidine kinase [Anaerolentibacter hominis]|uniref:HAMP domain-containing sensor histidine kinase n=1 Tax=Anaerolentibacter hominis TaxID=3079009 RepID=UPI0031B83BA2
MMKEERYVKHSIRYKLVLILCIALGLIIFCYWLFNLTFLGRYYQASKVNAIGRMYNQAAAAYDKIDSEEFGEEGYSEDAVYLEMERLGAAQDMSLYIFDIYNNNNVFYLVSEYPKNLNKLQLQLLTNQVTYYLLDHYNVQADQVETQGEGGVSNSRIEVPEVLKKTEQFGIYKVHDERMDSSYIELFGSLGGDTMVYIRSNFESIQESVAISNKFLGYMGCITVLLGTIAMFLLSRRFTDPIVELARIAEEMSDLNFDVKYETNSEDEIGILGNSINQLSEKLEDTISELKSANNELLQDIAQKTEVDEMRKEFLSNVSHELKTPIALIRGYAEGLKDNINDDEESRDFYCDVIVDEAVKMNEMVKKLLTLNQMEFGNDQVQFERFDLTALIRTILSSAEILFQQKEATVVFEHTEPVHVWADEFMAEEVLTNYISNAINHLSGEKKIEVSLELRPNTVRISVFNSGDPIPEEDLENVWVKFYKVDKARTREYGGSGIGLSIVKAIMNSLHQECGVYNREDGVVFWFELDHSNGEKKVSRVEE